MDEKPRKKMGRPTKYCEEMVEAICFRVATNMGGLKKLCEQFPELPEESTVQEWRYKYTDFSVRYAQAKMKQAELMAESLNDLTENVEPYIDEFGNKKVDSGMVAWRRLQADTIKWQATKLAPKIYGDRQQIDTNVKITHEDALKALE